MIAWLLGLLLNFSTFLKYRCYNKKIDMKKVFVISKQIHSSCSTFSSNDEFLKITGSEKDIDFPVVIGEVIISKNFQMLFNEKISEISGDKKIIIIHLEEDKTFYNKALKSGRPFLESYEKTDEFKDLVKSYTDKGWSLESSTHLNEFYERKEQRACMRRKKAGYVLWKKYDEREAADFQGGFSDEVFNELKDYIRDGKGVFGYIGHSCRKNVFDEAIESELKERGLSPKAIRNWVSSTDGRHFGDSLEGRSSKSAINKIKKYANNMFNLALIYGSEQHQGTAGSTINIREQYEKEGILLPEGETTHFSWEKNPGLMMPLLKEMFIDNTFKKL